MSYQRIMLGQGGLRAYIFRDLGCLWSTSCLLIVESLKSGCISFNGKRPSRISSKLIKILVHLFKLSIMFQNNVFCFQSYFTVSKPHFLFRISVDYFQCTYFVPPITMFMFPIKHVSNVCLQTITKEKVQIFFTSILRGDDSSAY